MPLAQDINYFKRQNENNKIYFSSKYIKIRKTLTTCTETIVVTNHPGQWISCSLLVERKTEKCMSCFHSRQSVNNSVFFFSFNLKLKK